MPIQFARWDDITVARRIRFWVRPLGHLGGLRWGSKFCKEFGGQMSAIIEEWRFFGISRYLQLIDLYWYIRLEESSDLTR